MAPSHLPSMHLYCTLLIMYCAFLILYCILLHLYCTLLILYCVFLILYCMLLHLYCTSLQEDVGNLLVNTLGRGATSRRDGMAAHGPSVRMRQSSVVRFRGSAATGGSGGSHGGVEGSGHYPTSGHLPTSGGALSREGFTLLSRRNSTEHAVLGSSAPKLGIVVGGLGGAHLKRTGSGPVISAHAYDAPDKVRVRMQASQMALLRPACRPTWCPSSHPPSPKLHKPDPKCLVEEDSGWTPLLSAYCIVLHAPIWRLTTSRLQLLNSFFLRTPASAAGPLVRGELCPCGGHAVCGPRGP